MKNQTSRQNAKNSIEKDFFKLMNNANFGYDCRNNLDNCQFIPIFDELKEVTYLKKYYNYFDQKVKDFVTSELIKADIDEEYNDALNRLSKDDRFYDIKLSAIKTERKNSLDSLESFDKKNKRAKKKRTLIDYLERKEVAYKNNKIKSIIDFDDSQAGSIKSLAVEVKTNVTVTTRFMKGKMLMFAKTSLHGFVYDMIDVFMYPECFYTN